MWLRKAWDRVARRSLPWGLLAHHHLGELLAVGPEDVRSAGQAGVEGVDRAENLQGALRVGQRGAEQGRFIGSVLALGVARRGVPGGGDDALVIGDLAVLNVDPMGQRAARG